MQQRRAALAPHLLHFPIPLLPVPLCSLFPSKQVRFFLLERLFSLPLLLSPERRGSSLLSLQQSARGKRERGRERQRAPSVGRSKKKASPPPSPLLSATPSKTPPLSLSLWLPASEFRSSFGWKCATRFQSTRLERCQSEPRPATRAGSISSIAKRRGDATTSGGRRLDGIGFFLLFSLRLLRCCPLCAASAGHLSGGAQ